MKKLSLLLSILVCCFSVSAQFKKDQLLLGGGMNWRYSQDDGYPDGTVTGPSKRKNNYMLFSPQIGRFLNASTVHGVKLNVGFSSEKEYRRTYNNPASLASRMNTTMLGAGYFLKKFIPVHDRIGLYGEGIAEFLHLSEKRRIEPEFGGSGISFQDKPFQVTLNAAAGLYFKPSSHFLLMAGTSLAGAEYIRSKKLSTNDFDIHAGISSGLQLSAFYIIP